MTDSQRLLDSASLGDPIDRLYRAAWALCGSRELAEDLVEETYARILSRPRLVRRPEDVGYLLRSLHNTFASNLRKEKRRVQTDLHGRPDNGAGAHEVYAAIASLPEDLRVAIIAVDVTGLSYEEASKCLKAPLGTLEKRLFLARETVADTLAGDAAQIDVGQPSRMPAASGPRVLNSGGERGPFGHRALADERDR